MSRDLDAILTEAVKLINPPPDSVEAFQAQLTARIECACQIHQKIANVPPPGEMKARADDYLNALLAARKKADAARPFYWSSDFAAALEQEIIQVDARTIVVVPKGAPQHDRVADIAVLMARDLIDPDPYRHPENRGKDFPPFDCPWRRRATLTRGGAWLKLASLIFEGATGVRGRDMMEYARHIDERKPRYVS
jgi:hypothetical protein